MHIQTIITTRITIRRSLDMALDAETLAEGDGSSNARQVKNRL
jgi:hypothetical protein